jgi:hypothetical protein
MTHQPPSLSAAQEQILEAALDCARSGLGVLEALRNGNEDVYAAARLRTVEHGFMAAAHLVARMLDDQERMEED